MFSHSIVQSPRPLDRVASSKISRTTHRVRIQSSIIPSPASTKRDESNRNETKRNLRFRSTRLDSRRHATLRAFQRRFIDTRGRGFRGNQTRILSRRQRAFVVGRTSRVWSCRGVQLCVAKCLDVDWIIHHHFSWTRFHIIMIELLSKWCLHRPTCSKVCINFLKNFTRVSNVLASRTRRRRRGTTTRKCTRDAKGWTRVRARARACDDDDDDDDGAEHGDAGLFFVVKG